jgi:hypothetical protein
VRTDIVLPNPTQAKSAAPLDHSGNGSIAVFEIILWCAIFLVARADRRIGGFETFIAQAGW